MTKRRTQAPSQYDPSAPRTSRREQLRQQRRRRSLTWNVILLGTATVFLLIVGWYFAINARPGPLPGETAVATESNAVIPDGTPIPYKHTPPSSGRHYLQPAGYGVQTTPVPDGTYVANLARGDVVILYQCPENCADLEQQLAQLYDKAPRDANNQVRMVITRYAGELEAPVVALAWGHQLNLAEFSEATLLRWYRRFVNQGA